jgi:feruloyl esterase
VEKGVSPHNLVASKLNTVGAVTFARPLCPFPEWAKYTGGNSARASSFICVKPDDDDGHHDDRRAGWNR